MRIPAKLPGQGFASWFHWNLDTIETAYRSSRTAADAALEDSRRKEAALRAAVAAGEAAWIEHDDDGEPVYDRGEALGEEQFASEQALGLIRLAFLITLHQYWEQRLAPKLPRNRRGDLHYDQAAAFEFLEGFGWSPRRTELNELRLIANCAKHSEGRSAEELHGLRPDLFDRHKIEKWEFPPGSDTLLVTDDQADGYFAAVRASVPRLPMTL